jgi:hypothetical protein
MKTHNDITLWQPALKHGIQNTPFNNSVFVERDSGILTHTKYHNHTFDILIFIVVTKINTKALQ